MFLRKTKIPYILVFEVVKPVSRFAESIGELLTLNETGEYQPANRRRGYKLWWFLNPEHKDNYRVHTIVDGGVKYIIKK